VWREEKSDVLSRNFEEKKKEAGPKNTESAHPEKPRLPLFRRRKHHPSQLLLVERATLSVLRSLLNETSLVEQHPPVKSNSTNNATC
jgi:hypothetical protein